MTIAGILLAFIAGYAAGGVFYGGLRWTLDCLPRSRHASLLLVGSFALRAMFVLAVLGLVGYGSWQRMLAMTAGLIVARYTLMPFLKPAEKEESVS
ncbi:MAG: ATP synthase subunit I [Candidatus Sumerlaeota bacterium]